MALYDQLQEALQGLGFETMGQVSFGRWKGYAVSVSLVNSQYMACFAVHAAKTDQKLRRSVQKAVAAAAPRKCAVLNAGSFFGFALPLSKKMLEERQLPQFLDAFAAALRENGLAPSETCSVCGGQQPESLCYLGSYQPVHSRCVQNMAASVRENSEQNQENGSYLTGLVGGILGTLVGLIPSVLTSVFMDRIYGLLFALVPLAGMWGYRKLKGKQDKGAIAIIIVLSLLGVFVMQMLSYWLYLVHESGLPLALAFRLMLGDLLNAEGLVFLAENSLAHFLFMALGIFIAWRYVGQTNSGAVRNMDAALSTLRRNPDAGEGYAFAAEEPESAEEPTL